MTKNLKELKKRRPKKLGYRQWTEEELALIKSHNFLKEFYNTSVDQAKDLVKKHFPKRSYDSVRQKILYIEKKNEHF